jgi:hypothetical protein
MVQFSAVAYSPRLDVWFARDKLLYRIHPVRAALWILKRCS